MFVVHALTKGAMPPNRVANSDLEKKTVEYHSMKDLPLKWVQMGTFPTGEEVKMLVSTARTTSRALASQTTVCSGGQFWFAIPIDYKENPGNDFVFDHRDDLFYFVEDMWCGTQAEVKRRLSKEGIAWVDFCHWDEQHWLDVLLTIAVEMFFDYKDDLHRDECEPRVTELLADTFRSFKKKREAEELLFQQHKEVAEQCKHFKIYPENECLQDYLLGDCKHISKWSGKAEAVYPHVRL